MKRIIVLCCLLLPTLIFAKVRINDLQFKKGGKKATVTVVFDKALSVTPELLLKDKIIQISVPDAIVWPQIDKKVSLKGKVDDTELMAYQFDKSVVRVRALVPYSVKNMNKFVDYRMEKNKLIVTFPTKKVAAVKYETSYLDKLIKDKAVYKDEHREKTKSKKSLDVTEDKVAMALSANKKTTPPSKNSFAFGGYIFKFVFFLGLVLLIFYGVVHIFKRSMNKSGKLNFMNDMKNITVMNTTYIGPKKSLMLVKVHKQVFLVGSDDKGMYFLSEINDKVGLIKDGEKEIAGDNFDSNLNLEEVSGKTFKVKEDDIMKSSTPISDKPRFTDQLKDKIRGMKPLQ